jgi:hypothetical protein
VRVALICLALCVSSWATPSFIQKKCSGTTTTDAFTGVASGTLTGLTAVGAGHLLIAQLFDDNGNHTISSVDGETWTHCTSCTKAGSATQEVDASYVLSATGGETSFLMTITANSSWNFCIYEYSTTTSGFSLDGTPCTALLSAATPNACTATGLTGTTDVVFSALAWTGNLTGVSAPFADFTESNGNGSADSVNVSVGTGAHFTPTTSGSGPDFTIAFKEAAGGAAAGFNKRRKLEKLGT